MGRSPDPRPGQRAFPSVAATVMVNAALRRGMSLIEVLIVIVLMSIFAAAVVPQFQPDVTSQLDSVAQIIAADLDFARNLAVNNGSTYRVTFDVPGQRYVLDHTGSNVHLDALPTSPFRRRGDPPDQHIVELAALPRFGPTVELVGAQIVAGSRPSVSNVEFGPLGSTTRSETTMVWLACGQADERRFLSIEIDPVTGISSVGEMEASQPAGISR